MLRLRVLGAAAGGGLPQWNCACACCSAARQRRRGVVPQTQSSLAATADGTSWVLFNASPDLRQQLEANPVLQPHQGKAQGQGQGPRDTPIGAVVLTSADVDHVAGLLSLRERQPFVLYATPRVQRILADNSIFGVLGDCVERRELKLGEAARIAGPDGRGQLLCRLFAVPGKLPLYLEDAQREPETTALAEDTVAAEIWSARGSGRVFYIPGCAALPDWLLERLRGATALFFDGTVYRDDELIQQGLGSKRGARMGHLAMSGPGGSLEALAGQEIGHKLFVHLNNSNPVWFEDSPERAAVHAAGWEVARDGMELELP